MMRWGTYILACALLAGFMVGMLPGAIILAVIALFCVSVWSAL